MRPVNRGWLLRKAKAGKLVMIESYFFDDQYGTELSTKELPVRIKADNQDHKIGYCNLWESDFRTKSGGAYRRENGTISLKVHSNCHYAFKVID